MMMCKALDPRDVVDSLSVSRKWGERGLYRIEDSFDTSIKPLKDYTKIAKKDWLRQEEIPHKDQQNNNN